MPLRFLLMPVVCGLVWLQLPGSAQAQSQDDLRALLEQQRKVLEQQSKQLEMQKQQLDELKNRMDSMKSSPAPAPAAKPQPSEESEPARVDQEDVKKIVSDYLKEKEEEKKNAGKDKDGWYEVGKNAGLHGTWNGYQPWFETDDKSFRFHFGGRTQFDVVWAQAPDNVQFGVGGIGKFQDGVNFRRARLEADGWLYEVFDFFCEYDFINTQNVDPGVAATKGNVANVPAPTDLWGGVNFLPILGTVRMGNMKPGIGLEHIISSRYLDFLERANYFDIYFNRTNGFTPGIQIMNWTEDERMAWQIGVFKVNNTVFGWNFADGATAFNARLTGLPIYRDNGRCLVHLGLGYQFDAPDDGQAILRNRWNLRNGPAALQNTVAFANIRGHHQNIFVPEFLLINGPLSVMAEYAGNYLDEVWAFTTQPQGLVVLPAGTTRTYYSQSAYVSVLYFLTGEHRPYARTGLHGSGAAPTRIVPNRNFYWLPGRGMPNPLSCGAWQVGARYSWAQLSNSGIFGGQTNEVTLGLNWFLNANAKIQWNYDIGYRNDLGPTATSEGYYQGFGTRLAFDW